jgi:hypothetical protein
MTLKGHLGKKADIGGTTGIVDAAGSMMAESAGAGKVWCEGGGDGDETEGALADAARAGRIGDIGGAGESSLGEAGKVSNSTGGALSIIASECKEQANVDNGGRDGGMVGGGVAGLERGESRRSPSSSGPRSSSASL